MNWVDKEQGRQPIAYSAIKNRIKKHILDTKFTHVNPNKKNEFDKTQTYCLGDVIASLRFEVKGPDSFTESHLTYLDAALNDLVIAYALNANPKLENQAEIENAQREIDSALNAMFRGLLRRSKAEGVQPIMLKDLYDWFTNTPIWPQIDAAVQEQYASLGGVEASAGEQKHNAKHLALGMKEILYTEKLLDREPIDNNLFQTHQASESDASEGAIFDGVKPEHQLVPYSIVDIGSELWGLAEQYAKKPSTEGKPEEYLYDIKTELQDITHQLGQVSSAMIAATDSRLFVARDVQSGLENVCRSLIRICNELEGVAKENGAIFKGKNPFQELRAWLKECNMPDEFASRALLYLKENGLHYDYVRQRDSQNANDGILF